MTQRQSLSLDDIAAKAGVSRSTVSRVVNEHPNVSPQTRARVLRVIDEEKYRPNAAARIMVTRRTEVIGVVIPHDLQVVFWDPYYYPALLQGVSEATGERDYAMLLWVRQSGEDEERFYRRVLQHGLMDGLIVASARIHGTFIDRLLDIGVPFAMVERAPRHADRISYATIDNVEAARQIVDHLAAAGRRRIGLITGEIDNVDSIDRLEGYRASLQRLGLPDDLVAEGDFSRKSAYAATSALLERGVDAIFASNDIMAQGVYDRLHEAGLRVPDDVAVVGFDDLPTATQLKPLLTTVRQPVRDKGYRATELLLRQIDQSDAAPQHIILPASLIIRESCGAMPSAKSDSHPRSPQTRAASG